MSPVLFLAASLAGGVGAVVRHMVDRLVMTRLRPSFAAGILFINVSGSFALGCVAGLAGRTGLPAETVFVLSVGLLGGYTTLSAASVEALRLWERRRAFAAMLYAFGSLVLSVAAAFAGSWLCS